MPEIACDPASLAAASECYKKISPGDRDAAAIYLLNQILGTGLTVDQIVANSACYAAKMDKKQQAGALVYLTCLIVNKP